MVTAYKNKIYTGKTITWNQIADFGTLYGSGQYSEIFAYFKTTDKIIKGHKYFFSVDRVDASNINPSVGIWRRNENGEAKSWISSHTPIAEAPEDLVGGVGQIKGHFWVYARQERRVSNILLCDLTLMFGAGNEPTTVAEFWSHFDRKYYPYNTGESQPLFLISRKRKINSGDATLISYKSKTKEG